MKTEIQRIVKKHGLEATIVSSRPEISVVSYDVTLSDGRKWDGGYFIGEKNTANSKEAMIKQFEKFVIL